MVTENTKLVIVDLRDTAESNFLTTEMACVQNATKKNKTKAKRNAGSAVQLFKQIENFARIHAC